jgi:radical SAM superfamily enzyme YgiQ (UPF0313 family)
MYERSYLSHIADSYDEKPILKPDRKFIDTQRYEDAKIHGLSILSATSYPYGIEIARRIKESQPNSLVVLGGNYFFDVDRCQDTLKEVPQIDIICRSEGEFILLDLLKRLEGFSEVIDVEGTVTRTQKGKIVVNPSREPIRDLDSLPFADYSQLPLNDYLNFKIGTPVLPISNARGCRFNCSFCNENRIWGNYRSRSPENITNEIPNKKA